MTIVARRCKYPTEVTIHQYDSYEMHVIPESVTALLNPLLIREYFKTGHLQCEHYYWQDIYRKEQENNAKQISARTKSTLREKYGNC